MISFFYNTFLFLYLICNFWKLFQKKYYSIFLKRIFIKKSLFENIFKKKIVWIHAVSVGETKALKSLVYELKKKDVFVIISSITNTGHNEAKKTLLADRYIFMPFDFSFIWKKIFKIIKPYLIIISETDFWYNFLKFSKKNDSKIVLVNGKISDRSFGRYRKFKKFGKKMFSFFDLLCVQNKDYFKKFSFLLDSDKKIVVTGNLKISNFPEKKDVLKWKEYFDIKSDDKVITIASTHKDEEELILKNFDVKKYKIFLAPRHPERFLEVEKFLKENNYSYSLLSDKSKKIKKENIILIDTMGFLDICYQMSKLSIIGGSFVKIGGHNLLEPAFFNNFVLFGPFVFSQKDLEEIVERYGFGKKVSEYSLNKEIEDFFKNPYLFKKNEEFLKEMKKPLKITLDALNDIF